MDSLKMLIYIASRIGMMILLCVFGAFIGVILFPAVCTLMPGSWHTVKTFKKILPAARLLHHLKNLPHE